LWLRVEEPVGSLIGGCEAQVLRVRVAEVD